jgi:hypothetical protein
MVRFCTKNYEPPSTSNLKQSFLHLTNFSLNKNNPDFDFAKNKKSLSSVFSELEANGVDPDGIVQGIERIVRLTLIAAQPVLASSYHTGISLNDGKSRCFEILGFDVLLDERGCPWLLEVNCMPSLANYSEFDADLKTRVISGTLKVLDLDPFFKRRCEQRFKTLSTQGGQPSRVIFDANRECEIAKTTEWKQLLPITDDPAALQICERALIVARDFNTVKRGSHEEGSKPKRPSKEFVELSAQPKKPPELRIQPKEPKELRPRLREPLELRVQPKEPPELSSRRRDSAEWRARSEPKKPVVPPPITKKSPRLRLAKAAACANPKSSRAVIMADEARSLKIEANERMMQLSQRSSIFALFDPARKECPIIDAEERDRLRAVKKQTLMAASLLVFDEIRKLFAEGKIPIINPDLNSAQNDRAQVKQRVRSGRALFPYVTVRVKQNDDWVTL